MLTEDFNYDLPNELIAQNPVSPRDSSKLMVINRDSGLIDNRQFFNLPDYLNEGDVVVFNDSKVIPARIRFEYSGREAEILLINEVGDNTWKCMVRPGKVFKPGIMVQINEETEAQVLDIDDEGYRLVQFNVIGEDFEEFLCKSGEAPYPPYIKNTAAGFADYQTIYAKDEGSVAAPTAGLHFTEQVFKELRNKGVQLEFVTLHVGPGTFLPVKVKNIIDHKMHSEVYEISASTAVVLNNAKENGKRVIAVGTTSVRVLESSYNNGFRACKGETGIFIYPGYEWKCVDALVTNFHLPKSTLLMLVSSFAGKDLVNQAYGEAIKNKYRFYSFGDAMLII